LAKLWSKLDYFRSQAARRDGLINVSDVGVEMAQVPFAFRSILAQGGYGACFYEF